MTTAEAFDMLDGKGIALAERDGRLLLWSRKAPPADVRELARQHKGSLLALVREAAEAVARAQHSARGARLEHQAGDAA